MTHPETAHSELTARLNAWKAAALIAGAAGLGASVALLFVDPHHFYQGYLFSFTFWIALPLGSLAILMLHHLVAGAWGFVTQRILEAGASTIAVAAVLFIPVLFGLHDLYEWTHVEVVSSSPILQHKRPYLNPTAFVVRAGVYFLFWLLVSGLLVRWSRRQDDSRDPRFARRLRGLSAAGLIGHVLILTFASVDWVMSLEPHWYSTIYGWMIAVSQSLVAIACTVVVLVLIHGYTPLREAVRTKHFHDYGNLMLTFVVLWTYMMFAQYLIMWSGDVPEDIRWYVRRKEGLWFWVGPFLILFHFSVPFLLLLFRRMKRSAHRLAGLSVGLVLVHAVFVAWLVLPAFGDTTLTTYLAGVASWIGIGGSIIMFALSRLAAHPLLPAYDPRFEEVLEEIRSAAR